MNDGTVNKSRRRFLIGSTTLVSAAGGVGVAVPFVGSWKPSARALAAGAPITIDISRLETGELLGPMPAWYIPTDRHESSSTWVILVHGSNADRQTMLKMADVAAMPMASESTDVIVKTGLRVRSRRA